jgi:glycosyltransferase involved in cell wall biosynthesis
MRVLFWTETFLPIIGGVEVMGSNFLRALSRRGYEFTILTSQVSPDLEPYAEYEGIPVQRLPFEAALVQRDVELLARARQQLVELKRTFQPALIHLYHPGRSSYFHLLTARVLPRPLLASLHQTYWDPLLAPEVTLGATLRSANWIAACSVAVLEEMRHHLPEIAPRSSVIWNSLEQPPLSPAPPAQPPRLLCLGRLYDFKRFDLALRAFAPLASSFPGVRLLIAGDGPERSRLEALAGRLGLAPAVEFLGWVPPDDVPGLIRSATAVVIPSGVEAFGLVALQAAQLARPVVATRVGGLPEVVMDGETGLLVEPGDLAALTTAIAALLSDPARARAMGEAARLRARDVFGWEQHVAAYERLYQRLAGAGSG